MKIELKELINIEEVLEAISKLPDYRRVEKKIEYNNRDIIFGVMCSMFLGNKNMIQMHEWIEVNYNEPYFKKLINKEDKNLKIPSYPTVRRMIINIDSNKMEEIFRDYFIPRVEIDKDSQIASDGKMMNGSGRKGKYDIKRNSGMLNMVETKSKIILAHRTIGSKESEIPAFQEMLKLKFSDEPFLHTFDAMNTQEDSLNAVHNDGKRYLAKVKGNQGNLQKQTIKTFEEEYKREDNSILTIRDKRASIEGNKWVRRETSILSSQSCNLIMYNKKFNHVKTIIKQVKYSDDGSGKEKVKENYLIANFEETPSYFQKSIKDHWICETYHYHKDMLTCEDDSKLSVNPFGLSILMSFVINAIQLYLNKHKPMNKKLKMSKVYSYSRNNPYFLGKMEKPS
ncbi:MAG: ISAs1 family transposase [Sulfurovaceae bacterium]|nr:ISAs1 family transposase [Sulfurovaceae bacterium]